MGRPEQPIPTEVASTPLGLLAVYLRQGRRQARYLYGGMPYTELARRTGYSASTLHRAASGRHVPARQVVLAYADACGVDLDEADRLWQQAWRQQHRRPDGVRAVPPEMIQHQADLGVALVDLYERSGAPSLRTMERRARVARASRLSRSSLQRTLARQRVPATREELEAFLLACGVPEEQRAVWQQAWGRALQQWRAELAEARRPLRVLEAKEAGTTSGQISTNQALRLVRGSGYLPVERFRGFAAPWTVRCLNCLGVLRVQLSDLVQDRGGCTCHENDDESSSLKYLE
ncbi:helix-turn-helix domain-containing protein [Streptomyces aculeolatus]